MKKRNKKYNPRKAFKVELNRILKDVVIVSVQLKGQPKAYCQVMRFESGKFIAVNKDLSNALTELCYPWTIYCAVTGTTQVGDDYLQSVEMQANAEYLQRDLQATAEDIHGQLYKEFNKNHFKSACWIASPIPREITDEQATRLFTKLGAWDTYEYDLSEQDSRA